MTSSILKDFNIVEKLDRYRRRMFSGLRSSPPSQKRMCVIPVPVNMFTSVVSTKGLSNEAGENNCFLNSAVQILWHLDAFRKNFNLLSNHTCLADSCIFCALKVIFIQFQFNDEKVLPPDALRTALAVAFKDQQKFQLRLMDDAAECFENILARIHFHLSNGSTDDTCTLDYCIPHAKFAMSIIEQVICNGCGATSEPFSFVQLVHYVTARTIISEHSKPGFSFSDALRLAYSETNPRSECPSKCGGQTHMERTLTNIPDVISIGLIWESDQQSAEQVKEFVEAIGTNISLLSMFDSVVDVQEAKSSEHKFVGMVCYYGRHYSVFVLHSKSNCWMSCDDANVTDLGPNWQSVVEKCYKGRYQPLLLLYQNPSSKCISTKNLPKKTTTLAEDHSAESKGKKPENENNSCNVGGFPTTATAYDLIPASVSVLEPTAPAIPSDEKRSPEAGRLLPAPSVTQRARDTSAFGYWVPTSSDGVPSWSQAVAKEPFDGNAIHRVPTSTPNFYQPHWSLNIDQFHPNLPQRLGNVAANVSDRSAVGCNVVSNPGFQAVSSGFPLNLPSSVPASGQRHTLTHPQSVLTSRTSSQCFSQYGQNIGVPAQGFSASGANFGVVPAYGSANTVPRNQDYSGPCAESGVLLPRQSKSDTTLQIPHYGGGAASPEINLLEWSVIDKDSLLSSPDAPLSNVALGLTNSDSTSSLYDNVDEFGVVNNKPQYQMNAHASAHGDPLSRSTSLTESYYFVPSAKSFENFSKDKNFTDLVMEADQLMKQSEDKERSGELQAALICCNQANNLYSTAQQQSSSAEISLYNREVDLKRIKSYNRSTILTNEIEINQNKSRINVQHRSDSKPVFSHQVQPSGTVNRANLVPTNGDLIFLEEPATATDPPKYQQLKDRLPQLYVQNSPSNFLRK